MYLFDLNKIAANMHSVVPRAEVAEYEVVRFLADRIFDSPLLTPHRAPAPSADEDRKSAELLRARVPRRVEFPPETAALYDDISRSCSTSLSLSCSCPTSAASSRRGHRTRTRPRESSPRLLRVRWYELLMASYAVTPNAALAGRTEQTGTPEFPANIFYVDPDEFAEFTRELTALSEIASDGNPELQRDELIDRSVIRFHRRSGPRLTAADPRSARAVGR
jgi:hypothetical protein